MTSRITPATRCTLWWLAALKLVVALVWIEPVVLCVLPNGDGGSVRLQADGGGSVRRQTDDGGIVRLQSDRTRNATSWRAVAATIWIAGVIAGLGVMLGRVRKTARMVSRADVVDADIQSVVRELCSHAGVSRAVGARWSGEIDAPMVAGLFRPVILLPAGFFDKLSIAEQRMAICHELLHVRRGDLWLGCVPALAERLFFFHPLAIIAAREYLLAREAVCDRAVLRLLDAAPQDYGRLLLTLGVSPMRAGLAAAGSSRSFSNLKRRIAMLGHRSPSSLARIAGWGIAAAAVCAVVPIQLAARPSSPPKLLPPHLKPWPWAASAEAAASPVASPLNDTEAPQKTEPAQETGERLEFVLVNRSRHGVTMSASSQDEERFKRLHGEEPLLWFRYKGKEYVVKDAAALDEAEQINRPAAVIGAKQGEIGAKQGAIGAKQGAVGARQGEIGARQGAIGAKQANVGARQAALGARETGTLSDTEKREIEAEHERLANEMSALNDEMEKLNAEMHQAAQPMDGYDEEMQRLSKEMDALSREMNEAVAKANREMIALAERLIRNGLAQVGP